MNPITVLVAEDHRIVREGLLALLKQENDIQVVGEAENGREAVALAATLCPDVIVIDVAMPLLNGLEATRQIIHANPGTRVLILSAHGDEAFVEQARALGAAGYLIKQASSHELAGVIREVIKGGPFFGPVTSKPSHRHQRKVQAVDEPPRKGGVHLTSREMEVLQLIAVGKANRETAGELRIDIKTVERHRKNLIKKLPETSIANSGLIPSTNRRAEPISRVSTPGSQLTKNGHLSPSLATTSPVLPTCGTGRGEPGRSSF